MGLIKFFLNNPELIVLAFVVVSTILGRVKKVLETNQGSGSPGIPREAPIAVRPKIAPAKPAAQKPVRVVPAAARPVPPAPVVRRRPRTVPAQAAQEGPAHDVAHAVGSALPPPERVDALAPSAAQRLFAGRLDLRKAVLVSEILGRPLSLR